MSQSVPRQPEETAALSLPVPCRISRQPRTAAAAPPHRISEPVLPVAVPERPRALRAFETRKRIVDIAVSLAVILLVLWWLVPLVGLLIRIESPGPVFFVQTRSGLQGRPFGCLKFRSMIVNRASDILPAQSGDPRITRVGSVIRKYCIDELPQFINVLAGTMSLVGPRPHMVQENRYYDKQIALYPQRYRVKPGITGPGQIWAANGRSAMEKMQRRAGWDDWYIRHRSGGLDARMLWLTLRYVASKKERLLPVERMHLRAGVPRA